MTPISILLQMMCCDGATHSPKFYLYLFHEGAIYQQIFDMKRLVLFDIGGVLLELHISHFFEELAEKAKKTASTKGVRKRFEESGLEDIYHDGKLSETAFIFQLRELLQIEGSLAQVTEIYRRRLGKPILPMVQLKKKLHEMGISVGLLSNTTAADTEYLSRNYPEIYETFGGPKIFSFEVGASKPNRKIYEIVPKCGDISFIEDTPGNLEIPKELGWKIFVYPAESSAILRLA